MDPRALSADEKDATISGKLQLVVKVEPDYPAVCIIVGGRVSTRNILVIFAVARRINAAVAGAAISVDLGHASITDDALEQLRDVAKNGLLPLSVDPARIPCRLRIEDSSHHPT
ncbi:hypothetical protein J2790_001808 [Paenarthrobacter nicotinovorans]|uniref:hypothetical protein n=1 Tax=Micrococcaceae TaxID=1268 RepID=UPI000876C4E6|nr:MULTISPECIES: hypothetical protein [Micrococcaceae]MDR6436687.1 hypothetical protein [Paenarthrobacter nicotinovorans]SCZ56906.1 hypothetical protein SAMN02799638_02005 [Arthrobacter sp. UNCCL28]